MTPSDIAAFSSIFSPFPPTHPWDYVQHFLAGFLACPSIYCILALVRFPKVLAFLVAFIPATSFLIWKEIQDIQAGDSFGWIGDGISDFLGLTLALFVILLATAIRKKTRMAFLHNNIYQLTWHKNNFLGLLAF